MTALEEIIRAEIRTAGPMGRPVHGNGALSSRLRLLRETRRPVAHWPERRFFHQRQRRAAFWQPAGPAVFPDVACAEKPNPFWIIEQGAHDGQLACDILEWCARRLPNFSTRSGTPSCNPPGPRAFTQKCGPEPALLSRMTWFENLTALAVAQRPASFFPTNSSMRSGSIHHLSLR